MGQDRQLECEHPFEPDSRPRRPSPPPMPIEFPCTACGQLVRTPDSAAGKKGKCPHCGTIGQIPLTSPPAAVPGLTPLGPAAGGRSQGTGVRGQGTGSVASPGGAVISFPCESCG